MPQFMPRHPPWRRIVVISVLVPMMIILSVLAFAWPAARLAPREVPLGVVGTGATVQGLAETIDHAAPGAFAVHQYSTVAAARRAIRERTVYGAMQLSPGELVVFETSAASPVVAQLLGTVGKSIAEHDSVELRTVDVVPTSRADPRGVVLSSALLPLTICSVIAAILISTLLGLRPAWRQVVALSSVSVVAGIGAYLVAQGFLGTLPHESAPTCGALVLTILAISAPIAGFVALFGPAGTGLGAVLMVFIGNPFSGVTSAPEMLPPVARDIGQWLPPGAGAEVLRSTAYFDGNRVGVQLLVLLSWVAFGFVAIIAGHHTSSKVAAHSSRIRHGLTG